MKKIISIALALVMALSLVSMTWATENQGTVNVSTLAELQQALNAAAATNSGNTTISLNDNITLGETDTWQPVNVDGYHGAGVVTLLGNKHTITGLNAPLFAGGFAGNSGIVIRDLTLSNVNLTDDSTYASTGFGAFICAVDSMAVIELTNCQLVGGTITSTSGARVGGLIGWTSGYDNQNDGPVDTVIKIMNCSVENCNITAAGSLGGLIGHAGANPATYHDITNCSVSGNTLKSTKSGNSNYTGALVGTVNSGQVTISGSSATGNTLQQNATADAAASNEFLGRAVVNDTGLMIVDNKVVAAATKYGVSAGDSTDALDRNETTGAWEKGTVKVAKIGNTTYPSLAEAVAAAKDGDTVTLLKSGSGDGIVIPKGKFADKGLTIDFNKNSYIVGGVLVGSAGTGTNAFQLLQGNKITFKNGSIAGVTENTKPAEDTPDWHGAPAIVIQNYCDLTLDSMTITGGDETVYTMSNNNGIIVINNTTINAGGAKGYSYGPYAFDVCRYSNYPSVNVTVRGNSVINGNVEVSGEIGEGQSRQLTIENGTFNGKFVVSEEPANIAISGGTFSTDPSAYVTDDFTATKGPNGMWTVAQIVTPDPTPDDPQPERPAHTNRRYPANNTTTTTTDTKKDNVTSARTFDAGIAMYVGMSLLSVAGSAVVIGKKKEF